MSVLEFAIFSIKSPHTIETPELKSALQHALQVLKKASGFTFSLFHQIEDTSILHLVGSWTSVEAHKEFLVSPENLALLSAVKDFINVDVLYHANIEQSAFPVDAPCIAVSRIVVKDGEKEEFVKMWDTVSETIAEYRKPYRSAGGWIIDEESSGREWLQFREFGSAQQHRDTPESISAEYAKLMVLVEKYHNLGHVEPLGW